MAKFRVRVILHDAGSKKYDELETFLVDEGFSGTITSNDGVDYVMPDGEYKISGRYTNDDVIEKVKTACSKLDVKYGVLVSQSVSSKWIGLEKTDNSGF